MRSDWYDLDKLAPYDLQGEVVIENKLTGITLSFPLEVKKLPYYSLSFFKNDDRSIRVMVKNSGLDIINLTGAVGEFFWRTAQEDGTTLFTKKTDVAAEGQIGAADEGEMFFFIKPADTASLDVRQYYFLTRVTLSNGKTYTVNHGVINMQESQAATP